MICMNQNFRDFKVTLNVILYNTAQCFFFFSDLEIYSLKILDMNKQKTSVSSNLLKTQQSIEVMNALRTYTF